jgi:hypothetical protein
MQKYDVLKNCNLSEDGFSLSLTRGEVRDDIDSNFSKPYVEWHCDEKFLAVNIVGGSEDETEELDDIDTEKFEDIGANITDPNDMSGDSEDDEVAIDDEFTGNLEDSSEDETEETTEEETVEDEEDFPDFDAMSLAEVKSYAKDHNVDFAGLKKKADIIDAIIDELAEEE